jgi:hypothetical protein
MASSDPDHTDAQSPGLDLEVFLVKTDSEGLDYAIRHYWGPETIDQLEELDPELARDWRAAAEALKKVEAGLERLREGFETGVI